MLLSVALESVPIKRIRILAHFQNYKINDTTVLVGDPQFFYLQKLPREQLKAYKEAHGHVFVKAADDKKLSEFCRNTRDAR